MDNNLEYFPFPIIFIVISFVMIMLQIDVLLWTLYFIGLLVIVGIIYTIIYYLILRESIIKRKQPVIIEIIKNFLNPTIDKLKIDSKICGFEFPNSLDYLSGIISKDGAYKRFSKKRFLWFIKLEIKRYREYYDEINEKVIKLTEKAKKQKLVEEIHDVYGHSRILLINHNFMSGKKELDNLLQEYGLIDDIKEIEELTKKIPPKAKKLAKKLEKLRDKWIDKYNIV